MSQRICKGSPESEEVAHYVISKFLEHKRAEELVNEGKAMVFMSGMIHRSFHSSTSPYHTLYRQKGRVHGFAEGTQLEQEETVYDADRDLVIEAIQGILEEMRRRRAFETVTQRKQRKERTAVKRHAIRWRFQRVKPAEDEGA